MASTVITAFNVFMKNVVNLDAQDTRTARQDRNNLRTRVQGLQTSVPHFPKLYTDANINFGSFARRTKKRPLDDVDMFFCIDGEGALYEQGWSERILIRVNDPSSSLYRYTNDDNRTLSSIKVLNKFKQGLEGIYQYRSSEVNRRQETVVLTLNNKDWSFDLVPCFITTKINGADFYLIPDGSGNWKKADPRVDRQRTTDINQRNSGNVLNIIRLMKYWNGRATMSTMGSYLLENMILNYYEQKDSCSEYVDLELPSLFNHLSSAVYGYVDDPKGIQGNLNTLTAEQKSSISTRASDHYFRATQARNYENADDHRSSINKWREMFGSEFPGYG